MILPGLRHPDLISGDWPKLVFPLLFPVLPPVSPLANLLHFAGPPLCLALLVILAVS